MTKAPGTSPWRARSVTNSTVPSHHPRRGRPWYRMGSRRSTAPRDPWRNPHGIPTFVEEGSRDPDFVPGSAPPASPGLSGRLLTTRSHLTTTCVANCELVAPAGAVIRMRSQLTGTIHDKCDSPGGDPAEEECVRSSHDYVRISANASLPRRDPGPRFRQASPAGPPVPGVSEAASACPDRLRDARARLFSPAPPEPRHPAHPFDSSCAVPATPCRRPGPHFRERPISARATPPPRPPAPRPRPDLRCAASRSP